MARDKKAKLLEALKQAPAGSQSGAASGGEGGGAGTSRDENWPGFVHLRMHSAYSLLEGALPIKTMLKKALADNQPALAIADTNNLFGALEFSVKAMDEGIQPIIACQTDIDMEDGEEGERRGKADHTKRHESVVLIAATEEGYARLVRIISRMYLGGADNERTILKLSWLEEEGTGGIIALTGGSSGPVDVALKSGNAGRAVARLKALAALFPNRLYVELQRQTGYDKAAESAIIKLAFENELPLVATNEAFFPGKDFYEAHDALMAVAQNTVVAVDDRLQLTPDHGFKTRAEMMALFADLPEALENTVEIAKRCSAIVERRAPILPRFTAGEEDEDEDAALAAEAAEMRRQSVEGLEMRIKTLGMAPGFDRAAYDERLEIELSIIERMKFPGYFLIVADFIKWAKEHDIPVGPGRGSGAGSLVAYALTITDVDPLRFSLLFERFLNPERVSMPDFDVDFCMEKRDRVIDYVAERYGRDAVSQIVTFGTMAAKAVVRDVARAQGKPYSLGDKLSKLIPFEVGMTGVFGLAGGYHAVAECDTLLLLGISVADTLLRLDVTKLSGSAGIESRDLQFEPGGLQPWRLSDRLRGVFTDARGGLAASARFDIVEGKIEGTGQVSVSEFGFQTTRLGRVQGVNGTVTFSELLALTTEPGQTILVERLNPGVPLENGEIIFQLVEGTQFKVESASFPFAGGTLALPSFVWTLGGEQQNIEVTADAIELAKLVEVLKLPDTRATGTVSGRFPIDIDGTNILVRDARLKADATGGYISYQGSAGDSAGAADPNAKMAFEALKDFDFTVLELGLDGNVRDRMTISLILEGKSRKGIAYGDGNQVLTGQPFLFTITVNSALGELLRNAQYYTSQKSLTDEVVKQVTAKRLDESE